MKKLLLSLAILILSVSPSFAAGSYKDAYNRGYISTATTTTLKSEAGILHVLTVTGGTAGTIIVYDNTAASGSIIASFDSTNAIASYRFDTAFATGLTIITSAATKISVSYK